MAGFSGAVKLADLNDFLNPAEECVKPLLDATQKRPDLIKTNKQMKKDYKSLTSGASVEEPPAAQIGSVALSDCLACSGCVTSAETVLLEQQSGGEMEKLAKRASRAWNGGEGSQEAENTFVVVSLSTPSRTSLSRYFSEKDPSLTSALLGLALKEALGVDLVLDCEMSDALAVQETLEERRSRECEGSRLPLLTSHCPGFSCYAEKVLPPEFLPLLSKVRSSEQIQGVWVKSVLGPHVQEKDIRVKNAFARFLDINENKDAFSTFFRVYHVVITPCFDRKLEILRGNYRVGVDKEGGGSGVPAVDLALTTGELVALLDKYLGEETEENNENSKKFLSAQLKSFFPFPGRRSGSPGNVLHSLRRIIAAQLAEEFFLKSLKDTKKMQVLPASTNCESGGFAQARAEEVRGEVGEVEWKQQKNIDFLFDPESRTMRAYGFRNIQNVVKKLQNHFEKSGKKSKTNQRFEADFIEIMACPGGCINGGGQLEKKEEPESSIQKSGFFGFFQNFFATSEIKSKNFDKVGSRRSELSAAHHGEGEKYTKNAKIEEKIESYKRSLKSSGEEWREAKWSSLLKDEEGKDIVSASVLKW